MTDTVRDHLDDALDAFKAKMVWLDDSIEYEKSLARRHAPKHPEATPRALLAHWPFIDLTHLSPSWQISNDDVTFVNPNVPEGHTTVRMPRGFFHNVREAFGWLLPTEQANTPEIDEAAAELFAESHGFDDFNSFNSFMAGVAWVKAALNG